MIRSRAGLGDIASQQDGVPVARRERHRCMRSVIGSRVGMSAPTVRSPHRRSEVITDPLGGLTDRIVRQVCVPRRRSGLPVTEERTDEVK